jgi:hypothetical protein
MSIDTEFFGGPPPKWVSGTTYALDFIVRSPASQHHYVRIVAGAGTTDPSADGTNWARVGAGGIKSIQRGVISFSAASATATVSSVDTSKSKLKMLGFTTNTGSGALQGNDATKIVLTNATTITATKAGALNTIDVSWELEEKW